MITTKKAREISDGVVVCARELNKKLEQAAAVGVDIVFKIEDARKVAYPYRGIYLYSESVDLGWLSPKELADLLEEDDG